MLRNTLITLSDNKIGVDQNADNKADFYQASVLSATDYYAFGMSMKERSWQSEKYRYGFNGKEKDSDIGEEMTDFGARLMNSKIGRWMAVDPLAGKYVSYSPYHFGYCNPIVTIDTNGEENIIVVGNQSNTKVTTTPNSDFKNAKKEQGYRYGNNKRHFLDAGLNEALRLKKDHTENSEGTTLVIYKGTYTAEELKDCKTRAENAGITFIEVSSAKEIINYINAKDLEGNTIGDIFFGSERDDDKITDFSYIGHGWTKALYPGYNAIQDEVDRYPLHTGDLKANAFDLKCNVNLNSCASGFDVMDDFVNRLVGGTVTGYKVTVQWGKGGLGTSEPFDKFYYPSGDPRRNSSGRPIVPKKDRTRVEEGKRTE